ncbi:hypothetical protein K438DRAFT_2015687 [Mycena galopus ATCC 62051]|nr:hypothetical protein K438DRAFT_2015687 [Mycena galopus ATCC 62051]
MVNAEPEPAFRLHLAPELDGLYLDVPVDVAASLCLHPVKYLRFLGYCILGVDGTIAREDFDGEVLSDGDFLGEGVYYFVREGEEDVLEHAVDPEALTYSHASENTDTREDFRSLVAERDVACTFTNMNEESCRGIHIVPFSKDDAWMKQIVHSRIPEENEDVSNLTTINDIRNGILVSNSIHPLIDKKKLTPNLVLACEDIPARTNNKTHLFGDVKYSTNPRYTLQWLMGSDWQKRDIPNNQDAAFKKHTKKPKASPLLLNYNYGVAALKWWGKGPEYLITARKRPTPPIAAPLGPVTTTKFTNVRKSAGLQGGSGRNREVEDNDERRQSEAELLVLTLYANTPAARARRAKQQAEHKDWMAEWRNGVASET